MGCDHRFVTAPDTIPESPVRQMRHINQHAKSIHFPHRSDFDGFTGPELTDYLTDISQMEQLWNAMKKAGITERQLDKIWQGNAMRIIEEVL